MALIKSISGIRGTIGGNPGKNLTPLDIIKFTSAYGMFMKEKNPNKENLNIVVARDARISGKIISSFINNTFFSLGINVIDINLATTPTTEMVVIFGKYDGGVIITASHNPKQWNAMKLLNEKGEFLSASDGERVIEIAKNENFFFSDYNKCGKLIDFKYSLNTIENSNYNNPENCHIEFIKKLPYIKTLKKNYKIAIDCINSVGTLIIPNLLIELGIKKENIIQINCNTSGDFTHNPEPLPENLINLSNIVKKEKCDLGFAVDPDVDRLAIISEDGSFFGEEYTLVACSDYVLSKKKGNIVSNLSSTRALRDLAEKHGVTYNASAVGEVNVIEKMKESNAIIGGEGNGGVILPELHYGRDALVGIALFLNLIDEKNKKTSEIRKSYPNYFISKNKIELNNNINIDDIFLKIKEKYKNEEISDIDGVKIDFISKKEWVHLRKSNTEPIIRIYAESTNEESANKLASNIINIINNFIKQ